MNSDYVGFEPEQASVDYHAKRIDMLGVEQYARHAALLTGSARIAARVAIENYQKDRQNELQTEIHNKLVERIDALELSVQAIREELQQQNQASMNDIQRLDSETTTGLEQLRHTIEDASQLSKVAIFIASIALIGILWAAVS